jgi:hypothetical protein
MADTTGRSLRHWSATARSICDNPDPVAVIDHALQLELCDLLECLADGLPDFNRAIARSAAAILRQGLGPHQRLGEDILFPLLRRHAAEASPLHAVMRQLEAEHATDEDLAHELADELQLLADTGILRNAEMLGYMLRGFFEQQRRHIEWENHVLLPLGQQTLTKAGLVELQDWITQSARPACIRYSATPKRIRGRSAACRARSAPSKFAN